MDVAASDENAMEPYYFTLAQDGLAQPWNGHRVWCNPPYSNIRPWVEKAWYEMDDIGGCDKVVMLLPANRTEQSWWQELVEPFRDYRRPGPVSLRTHFIQGRVKFGNVVQSPTRKKKGNRPPFSCVFLVWSRL